METPALRLDQEERVTPGKSPRVPVPRAFPGAFPAAGRGRAGPGCGGGGRAGGGRSRSKMAAPRRSLLQSVSGIFPPPPSVHTRPPGGCEGVPGPPPHPAPALPSGQGEVSSPWGGGWLLFRPLRRLRAGGPGLRGSLRDQRSARWAGRPLCRARRATGAWGAVPALRASGCPAV